MGERKAWEEERHGFPLAKRFAHGFEPVAAKDWRFIPGDRRWPTPHCEADRTTSFIEARSQPHAGLDIHFLAAAMPK